MSEIITNSKPTTIDLPAPEGLVVEQMSTRGDGSVELGEAFGSDSIDFSRAMDHLRIHTDGQVAGSQFNGELFATPEAVAESVQAVLPETLNYDQYDRVELTITADDSIIGYSGVRPRAELEDTAGVRIERGMRTPGGETAEVGGIKGAWFPEMTRNPETGAFEVALDTDGNVKNPHGKFEPEAWIAHVDETTLPQTLATNKATVIIQRNPESDQPTVLTVFPGENAPAFPAKIESEAFQADTLEGGPEAAYWSERAFIKQEVDK